MDFLERANIAAKQFLGKEPLTDDEQKFSKEYDLRYELVCFLYKEKMKSKGKELKQFSFTPGDKFVETPIYDVVHALLDVDRQTEAGNYEVMDFGDEKWVSNPPRTDKKKKSLKEFLEQKET